MKKAIFGFIILALQGCQVKDSNAECKEMASKFSCSYLKNEATYKVFYWKDVFKGNPNDDRFVGMAKGLTNCRDVAIGAHRAEMEYRKRNWKDWSSSDDNWSERSYICMLTKDGKDLEKHRA